jgi:uncharacterized protein
MKRVASLLAGALFGVGLVLSGMTQPAKVKAFLDIAGHWDASLLLVMASAVAVHMGLGWWIRTRGTLLFGGALREAPLAPIDRRLVAGAAIFGIGWGLGGFCPGPALVASGAGYLSAGVFAAGMALGMIAERAVFRRS